MLLVALWSEIAAALWMDATGDLVGPVALAVAGALTVTALVVGVYRDEEG